VLAAALVLLAAPLAAELDPAMFEGQPPLTRDDVPAALDCLQEMKNDEPRPERMADIAAMHGVTVERLAYLSARFMTGAALLMDGGPTREEIVEQAGTPLALPTPDELEVIRGALDDILQIILH
jgi:hypothetical protein